MNAQSVECGQPGGRRFTVAEPVRLPPPPAIATVTGTSPWRHDGSLVRPVARTAGARREG